MACFSAMLISHNLFSLSETLFHSIQNQHTLTRTRAHTHTNTHTHSHKHAPKVLLWKWELKERQGTRESRIVLLKHWNSLNWMIWKKFFRQRVFVGNGSKYDIILSALKGISKIDECISKTETTTQKTDFSNATIRQD